MGVLVVLVTAPRDASDRIAERLVSSRLAACVNVVRGVRSTYWWQGKVESAEEDLLIIKTDESVYGELERAVKEMHPYEVPEIIALRVERGLEEYISWVSSSVSARGVERA